MLWSIKAKFSADMGNLRGKKGLNIAKFKRLSGLEGENLAKKRIKP